MIRNRLLASACRLLPLWQKGVANPLFHLMVATPHQHCGCALPLRLSIYCQRLRKENQSHQHDSKKNKKVFYIYIPKNPPLKKLLKIGRGKGLPCPTTVVMVTDWLRPPCFKMVVGLDLDTNRHGIPIPQGWITPTTTPPPPPYGRGRGHRTHQEALTVFVVNLWNTISMLLTTGTPHSWMIQVRPEKTLYYILFYLYSLRLVPNGYFIRDTSSITRY